ncbi:MAG: hypothetical protein ACOC4L_03785, partial [Halanaerobium sp.]
TNSEVRDTLLEDASEEDQAVFDFIDEASENSGDVIPLQPPAYEEVVEAYEEVYWEVIYGQITPEEGAEMFREDATKLLED